MTGHHRLTIPMLIATLKDHQDSTLTIDQADVFTSVKGFPLGLLTQVIERLKEAEDLRLLRLAVMKDEEEARTMWNDNRRHPTATNEVVR